MKIASTVHLSEAGKVLAKRNLTRLKTAIAAMQEMLSEIEKVGETSQTDEAARDMLESVLRQSDSVDGRRELIRQAVKALYHDPINPDAYVYCWVRELFPENAVYERDGKTYQVAYTIDKTGDAPSVILGQPIEVELAYIPVGQSQVSESGERELEFAFVPLIEKAVRRDGTIPIKIINPGWGTSGYYGKEVIERDGPKVFTQGTKMFWNHPTPTEEAERPERDLNDLAAVLTSNARWEDAGSDGPGLYADAKVYETYQKPVNDMAADIGVSIRSSGKARMGEAEGKKGPIIEAIIDSPRKSIDFVTYPGRGGKILELFESMRPNRQAKPSDKEAQMAPLTEAQERELRESLTSAQSTNQQLQDENARLKESAILRDARDFVTASLAAVELPNLTRDRLIESLSRNPVLKDGKLDQELYKKAITEAVAAEVKYLADVTGSGRILGMGGTSLEEGADPKPEDSQKSLQESFARLGLSESAATNAAKGRA